MTVLFMLLAFAQGGNQPAPAAPIITKMMARYKQAKSMVGTITQTAEAGGQSARIVTDVQYERPSLLYIRQTEQAGRNRVWTTSSTGQAVSYDQPQDQGPQLGRRLVERQVSDLDGKVQTVEDVYHSMASHSLGDKSVPLDLAIGNTNDLIKLKGSLATLVNKGKVKLGEEETNLIVGGWREGPQALVSATYEMYITDEGELRRFVYKQDVLLEKGSAPLHMVVTWDCDFKVDAKPDPSVFKIYK